MARKNRKRGRRDGVHVVVVLVDLAQAGDKRLGVRVMSYSNESGEQGASDAGVDRQEDETSGQLGAGSEGSLKALDELERFHEADREEFARMAAVQELGPQLKEALNVLLALSPEALETLAGIARLPVEDKRLIRRAVSLPDEVKAALRGLLDD